MERTPGPAHRALHEGWTLTVTDGPAPFPIADVPATVPGTLVTDLLEAGLVPDPYLDRVEHELSWTGWCDVLYRTAFDWSPDGAERVDLVAASLDTAATIDLNGHRVAAVQNQHRSWRFEVTDLLREGTNHLELRFASPLRTAHENNLRVGTFIEGHDYRWHNGLRKMACNFGWDWGPVLLTSGIAGPLGLQSWSTARIEQVRPRVDVQDGAGHVRLDVYLQLAGSSAGRDAHEDLTLDLIVRDPDGSVVASSSTPHEGGPSTLAAVVENPRRWWPRGYGEQPLYTLDLELRTATGEVLDAWMRRVGLRTAGLVQEADAVGTSCTVVVNDRPVLVKGANWIPGDCFPTRFTPERLRAGITDAVECGMNMLRVWGGGLYESEAFYDLCDELGILVWQDFLFACNWYSELEPIRSEVEAEAREQIVRLASHPSLVHWNGSNENIEAHLEWGEDGWDWFPEGIGWGMHYYQELLPSLLEELDPTRSYTPSSPYSIPLPEDPRHPDHGTIHNWQVWNDLDWTHYRDTVARLAAEFGYQSPPALATIERAITERPLRVDSETWLSHQKAEDGQQKLERGYRPHFPEPTGFEDFHLTTQLNQARALICGVGHYRSHWPVCSGTLIWQLGDCWPVCSWSVVDGDGRRKPSWYALRELHAPLFLSVQPRTGEAGGPTGQAIVLGNDTDQPLTGRLTLSRQRFDGTVLASADLEIPVGPRASGTLPVPGAVGAPEDPTRELLVITLEGTGLRHLHWFAEDRDLQLQPGALRAEAVQEGEEVRVDLHAVSAVRDVCLLADRAHPEAVADRQLLSLLAGESATVRIRATAATTPLLAPQEFLSPRVLVDVNSLLERGRARSDGGEPPS